jgi:hypothetical protein
MRAFYYLTDVEPSWPAERQEEHLRDFNFGALWAISIHEVTRGTSCTTSTCGRWSRSCASRSSSRPALVEGWAHYCEQMMVEAGFRRDDQASSSASSPRRSSACAGFIVGIRLHCEDLSVEQGVRFFRDEAFLEEPSARREAERGTFDPSYVLYTAGKLMLLKLRDDYKAPGRRPVQPPRFHDELLGNGTVPFWLHRALMLGESSNGAMLE